MKRLTMVLVISSLLLVSCATNNIPTPVPVVPIPLTSEPTKEDGAPPAMIFPKEPPEDMTWISPGKVEVGNFYPGARAEWDLLVHNGKDSAANFAITYRAPNFTENDYAKPPAEAQEWVIITDATPVLMPKETKEILIALDMPKGATAPPKWEFWVSIIETTQTGAIHTELCSRWLVKMRK